MFLAGPRLSASRAKSAKMTGQIEGNPSKVPNLHCNRPALAARVKVDLRCWDFFPVVDDF